MLKITLRLPSHYANISYNLLFLLFERRAQASFCQMGRRVFYFPWPHAPPICLSFTPYYSLEQL